MADALKVTPSSDAVSSGVTDTQDLARGLSEAVADTYRLVFKTHGYHWNVEGPLFFPIHQLTETQYDDMFAAADDLAERIRALGQLAPMSFGDLAQMSIVKDVKGVPSAKDMMDDLAKDHTAVARRFHDLIDVAEKHNDPVTADLVTSRASFHEKAAWMLRATAK